MPNQQVTDESAMVAPAYVERKLGISRPTRLGLEEKGLLNPVRFGDSGHRRYNRAEVDALADSHTSSDTTPHVSDETTDRAAAPSVGASEGDRVTRPSEAIASSSSDVSGEAA
ncbi:protein of unknown function [Agreia sp. COWG]|nr:protein of unknown function [Agreia sp. COWG]